jgi:hypothetical protein
MSSWIISAWVIWTLFTSKVSSYSFEEIELSSNDVLSRNTVSLILWSVKIISLFSSPLESIRCNFRI